MRALSLTQPWATLVAVGAKTIETRSWGTRYRGLVAIHAAKAMPQWAMDLALDRFATRLIVGMQRHHLPYRHEFPDDLPRGMVVATARLVDVRGTGDSHASAMDPWPRRWVRDLSEQERDAGDFSAGRYCWFLEDVRPLAQPISCRGALGLWDVPADIVAAIDEQIGGRA